MQRFAWIAAWLCSATFTWAQEQEFPRGQMVSIEVVIAQFTEPGDAGAAIDLGPPDQVSERLRELEEQGRVDVLTRVQLTTLEHQPASVQLVERTPIISAQGRNNVGTVNTYTMETVGVVVGVTTRVEDDGTVLAELNVEKSRLVPEPPREDANRITPPRTATLTVPLRPSRPSRRERFRRHP